MNFIILTETKNLRIMNAQKMKDRTKQFSISVLELLNILPKNKMYYLIENQLGRAALSVGSNYRVVSRAKSTNDFINKLKIVEEECDECLFFLEIPQEKSETHQHEIKRLWDEANEILSIVVSSLKTVKNNKS